MKIFHNYYKLYLPNTFLSDFLYIVHHSLNRWHSSDGSAIRFYNDDDFIVILTSGSPSARADTGFEIGCIARVFCLDSINIAIQLFST